MATTATLTYVPNNRVVKYLVEGKIEAVEIDWPPMSSSSPQDDEFHDHGTSYGFTQVLEGEVEETLRDGTVRIHRAGDFFTETPETIHKVKSLTGAKTLHVYSPPVTGTMKKYK